MRRILVVILLAGIVLVGVWTRSVAVDARSLSPDEAMSWRLSRYGWHELVSRTGADVHPPGYFVLLKSWTAVCGDSVTAMRLLSGLCGVATIVVVFALFLQY